MSRLNPKKLHVTFLNGLKDFSAQQKRRYTLTHSDVMGDLYLKIGSDYNHAAVSGWYTRLMRDEVLAEWVWKENGHADLHVYCHVSGGFIFGSARWRYEILVEHMPMVLQAICWGDKDLLRAADWVGKAPVWVHFCSNQTDWDRLAKYGINNDHQIME